MYSEIKIEKQIGEGAFGEISSNNVFILFFFSYFDNYIFDVSYVFHGIYKERPVAVKLLHIGNMEDPTSDANAAFKEFVHEASFMGYVMKMVIWYFLLLFISLLAKWSVPR